MRLLYLVSALACVAPAVATIWENGQKRLNPYPPTGQATALPTPIKTTDVGWRTYDASAPEIGYKGRWCSRRISWWAAPGVKFRYTGSKVAITFGENTSNNVLLSWRVSGLPWNFANVTANRSYQFVSETTQGLQAGQETIFEFHVTNWALGVQMKAVHVAAGFAISSVPNYSRKIEMIGDSLTVGYTGTYEAMSGIGWSLCEGLGNVEYSLVAYKLCYGSTRGQLFQWQQASDSGVRAQQVYGSNPAPWNFTTTQPADLVIINLGTNDINYKQGTTAVPESTFQQNYIQLINDVRSKYPRAQIIAVQFWNGYTRSGNTYRQNPNRYQTAIQNAVNYFRNGGNNNVYYFDTTGILQFGDINPKGHPTDVGYIKIAAHLMQFISIRLGWSLGNTGQEVHSQAMYYNDNTSI
ncbi:hypothetical protein Dda_3690 [Drechslerella dactyloides]|uniref:SGNH hydrolase-type esterase domain-containing protein n=1 Tax=Drechslerella dactyloides TaxID=74499 RepID=A0AAD6NK54_DREDA|nr:hypothetical protein Dda_3690 [Drechslerella dactyloides]